MKFRAFIALALLSLVFTAVSMAAKPAPNVSGTYLGAVASLDGTGVSLFGGHYWPNSSAVVTVSLNDGTVATVKKHVDNDGNLYGDVNFVCTSVALITATDSHGDTASAVPAC